MAASSGKLTLAEFERQYGDRKPYHEYWFGEAIPKAMPTGVHGLLQGIVMWLLRQAGFKCGSEVKLMINADFQPLPDVVATTGRFEPAYFTEPVEIAVEILSSDDSFHRVTRKCKLYAEWGIRAIVVVDPEARTCWVWDPQRQALTAVETIVLPNGNSITGVRIFEELDAALA